VRVSKKRLSGCRLWCGTVSVSVQWTLHSRRLRLRRRQRLRWQRRRSRLRTR